MQHTSFFPYIYVQFAGEKMVLATYRKHRMFSKNKIQVTGMPFRQFKASVRTNPFPLKSKYDRTQ